MNERALGLLGLAMRGGKLTAGREGALKTIRGGKARLIILAEDASNNSKKTFWNKGNHYGVPVLEAGSMNQLGKALGRGPLAVVVVKDGGFAGSLLEKIHKGSE